MSEKINKLEKAINNIEKCLGGKHTVEINDLKNAIKILQMGYKIAEQEKDIQLKDLENKNLKLENEIKLLKLECNTDETTTLLEIEKQSKPTMNVSKM